MREIRWAAKYENGDVFNQFSPDGKEHSYDMIPREGLRAFALWDKDTRHTILTVHLGSDQKLIYRRRCELTQGSKEPTVTYLVGWRRTVAGECIQSIAYVFEDGRIELAGKFDERHPWFYSPELRECEK